MRKTLFSLLAVSALAAPVVLHAQAADAEVAAATRSYIETGDARVIQLADRVLFPFGHEMPKLRCAPLRNCKVILNADEKYLANVPGDPVRWFVGETVGPDGRSLVVVKPQACNLTTSVTITTTKRIYDLIAHAPKCDGKEKDLNPDLPYNSLVGFYYPDDLISEAAGAREYAQQAASASASAPRAVAGAPAASASPEAKPGVRHFDPSRLDFKYRWQRDPRFPWVPAQVYDDGYHTVIRLPADARRHEQPLLYEVAPDGSWSLINYVIEPMDSGDVYKADRVLGRAVLVVGSKHKDPQRLLILKDSRR